MRIIGFTGKKLSGKTEASKCIDGFRLLNFKDALIQEIKESFPKLLNEICRAESQLNRDYFTVEKLFEKKPPLMRALMQNYGTDVRRADDPEYWVKRWKETVSVISWDVVVDDVRFLNEAQAVKEMGGIIIRIDRPGQVDEDLHISEMEMTKIKADYTIINDGTIEDLCKKVYDIYTLRENTQTR